MIQERVKWFGKKLPVITVYTLFIASYLCSLIFSLRCGQHIFVRYVRLNWQHRLANMYFCWCFLIQCCFRFTLISYAHDVISHKVIFLLFYCIRSYRSAIWHGNFQWQKVIFDFLEVLGDCFIAWGIFFFQSKFELSFENGHWCLSKCCSTFQFF